MSLSPFTPATTVSIAATTATAQVSFGSGGRNVVVTNASTVTIFIKFGSSSAVTAAVTDYPVLAGMKETLDRGDYTNVAAITASGSGTIYFTSGDGV